MIKGRSEVPVCPCTYGCCQGTVFVDDSKKLKCFPEEFEISFRWSLLFGVDPVLVAVARRFPVKASLVDTFSVESSDVAQSGSFKVEAASLDPSDVLA